MTDLKRCFLLLVIGLLFNNISSGAIQADSSSITLLNFETGDELLLDTLEADKNNSIQIQFAAVSKERGKSLFVVCTNPLVRNLELHDEKEQRFTPLRTLSGGKVWMIDALDQQIHFQLGSSQYNKIPVLLMRPEAFLKLRLYHTLFLGIYIGIIFLVIAVSLSIYWYNGETDFRNFSLMCLGVGLAQLSVHAFGQAHLEGVIQIHECFVVSTFANLSLFGSMFFVWNFLKLKFQEKRQNIFLYGFVGIGVVSLTLNILSFHDQAYLVLIWNNLFAAIWITLVTARARKNGHKGAGIFLLAWSFFSFGVVLFILKDIGVLPWNWFTQNSMTIGSGIECVFIGIAISYRIRGIQKQKNQFSQEKEIANLTSFQLQEENKKLSAIADDMRQRMFLLQIKPHYIANALNNINSLIIRRKNKTASKYVVSFGRMMRHMVQQPKDDYILLLEECTAINAYLMMENLRLANGIQFQIKCSPDLQMNAMIVPNMLLQPLIENAIIHGLQNLTSREPLLTIEFTQFKEYLEVKIDDNGLGRKQHLDKHKSNMTSDQNRTSMGTKLIQERLSIICAGMNIVPFSIIDKINDQGQAIGVTAIVRMPYKKLSMDSEHGIANPFESEWLVYKH
ncbi:MAG: 7TM diverse intracellular signaling domain-containing protein [Flavobacteriales bacterium]|nr:7TM diverse intracellular signaling domain-containing protein [Flavobacteriales bacterium]